MTISTNGKYYYRLSCSKFCYGNWRANLLRKNIEKIPPVKNIEKIPSIKNIEKIPSINIEKISSRNLRNFK